ncbi:MAG: hypothetical protein WCM93_04170 [Bacteroidota bacterium]
MKIYKGRIVDVIKSRGGIQFITTGVKKADQYKYDGQYGSNGTYAGPDHTYPVIYLVVCIYNFVDNEADKTVYIDAREEILNYYKRQKSSDGLIEVVKSKLQGKKVEIEVPDFIENADYYYKVLGLQTLLTK